MRLWRRGATMGTAPAPSQSGPTITSADDGHRAETSTAPERRSATVLRDGAFLAIIVALSFLPYVGRLGFYSDDWAYVGSLNSFGNYSNAGRSASFDFKDHIRQRPTQSVYTWLLFRLFRLNPLGYQLVNGLVLIGMTLLLYLVLMQLGVSRLIAISSAAVFGLFPGYSTDRFWLAAFGYPVTVAAFLLSLYANLRAMRAKSGGWSWKALAVTALVIGGLGYEVVLPLFVASIVLLWWLARKDQGEEAGSIAWDRRSRTGTVRFLAPDVLALSIVVAYKVVTAAQTGVPADYPRYLLWLATGSIATSYGAYGLALPQALRWSAGNVSFPVVALGGLVGAGVFAYLIWVGLRSEARWPSARGWLRTVAMGVIVFFLGYSIFLITARVLFTSTGIGNRVAIVASIGFAISAVGLFGWIGSWVGRTSSGRIVAFSVLVSLACASGFLIVNAVAGSWAEAWDREQAVLTDIREHVSAPPPGSALILDGTCAYVGPAIVFESNWDLSGALEVLFHDPTIRADVTTDSLSVEERGLSTTLYGTHTAYYPYGPTLFVYNIDDSRVVPLPNVRAARAYFARSPVRCPAGSAGVGVPVLPIDVWLHGRERSFFWR